VNPTLEQLLNRRSVRSYLPQAVPEEIVEQVLGAAMRAPTAGNMMLYSILRVQDQALKDKLAETCDHQPFIARAPLVLIFLADYQRWHDAYRNCGLMEILEQRGESLRLPGEGDLLLAACDTLIAAQSAVVAAESLGLGVCYIGDILENFETHRALLGLPRYVLPLTMVCMGYPHPAAIQRPLTSRFDPRWVVSTDRYHHLTPAEINEMFEKQNQTLRKAGSTFPNAPLASYQRKFSADFSLEMNRSVHAMIRSWCEEESQ